VGSQFHDTMTLLLGNALPIPIKLEGLCGPQNHSGRSGTYELLSLTKNRTHVIEVATSLFLNHIKENISINKYICIHKYKVTSIFNPYVLSNLFKFIPDFSPFSCEHTSNFFNSHRTTFRSICPAGDVFTNCTTIIRNNFIITDAIINWILRHDVNNSGSAGVSLSSSNVVNKQTFIQFTKTTFSAINRFVILLFVQLKAEPFVWSTLRFNANVNKVQVFNINRNI
jgi:hypothetical protein